MTEEQSQQYKNSLKTFNQMNFTVLVTKQIAQNHLVGIKDEQKNTQRLFKVVWIKRQKLWKASKKHWGINRFML